MTRYCIIIVHVYLNNSLNVFEQLLKKICIINKVEETLVPTHFHITFLHVKVSNMCKVKPIGESHSQNAKLDSTIYSMVAPFTKQEAKANG